MRIRVTKHYDLKNRYHFYDLKKKKKKKKKKPMNEKHMLSLFYEANMSHLYFDIYEMD